MSSEGEENEFIVSPGDVVAGKYLVEEDLGSGGMAFVVAARHIELDERFALKFLLPKLARKKDIVERFTREARAACKIRSQHVARVNDVGMHEDVPFLVMEHLTGRDLSTVIAEGGALPVQDAVEYAIQACDALAAAHSHGIIHRDVKPENLFCVAHEGLPLVKLLDFGISGVVLRDAGTNKLTGELSMGTPCYMSPEQIRNTSSADERSDLWSLGVVLYEMLAGVPPFDGATITELCARVLEAEAVPLRDVNPNVPQGVADVVARCMQKDPERRYADVGELASALLPFAPSRALASAESASQLAAAAKRASGRHPVVSVGPISTPTTEVHVMPVGRVSQAPAKRRWTAPVMIALALVLLGATAFRFHTGAGEPPPAPAAQPLSVELLPPANPAITMASSTRVEPPSTPSAAPPTTTTPVVRRPPPAPLAPPPPATTPPRAPSATARTTASVPATPESVVAPSPPKVELGY